MCIRDRNMPGIGISFGMERIFELLDGNDNIQNVINDNKVLLSYLDVKFIPKCLEIANKLRVNNISVDLVTDNFKLKKQLKYANKNNIPYVLIVGEDKSGKNALKPEFLIAFLINFKASSLSFIIGANPPSSPTDVE